MHLYTLTEAFWQQLLNHPLITTILFLSTSLLLYLFINEVIRYTTRNHDFNGPPNRFLVGNLPDIANNASETLRKWAEIYGDVYEMQLGNVPVIVVNSAAAAKELFGSKGHVLNSRPVFYTFHKVGNLMLLGGRVLIRLRC
jgi:3-hydroxyphenylacetate 6-hydroxylase